MYFLKTLISQITSDDLYYKGPQLQDIHSDFCFNNYLKDFINNIIKIQKIHSNNNLNTIINSFFIILAHEGIMSLEKRTSSYYKIAEKIKVYLNNDILENLINYKPHEFTFINIIQKNKNLKINNYFDLIKSCNDIHIYQFNLFVNYLTINLKSLADKKGYLNIFNNQIVLKENIDDHFSKLKNLTLSYFGKNLFFENNLQGLTSEKDIEHISYFNYLLRIIPSTIPSNNKTPHDYINQYVNFLKSSFEEHLLKKETFNHPLSKQ